MLSNVRKSKIKLESVKWEVAKSGMLFRCLSWFGSWLLVESRISSYMLSMYVTTELQPQALKCFFVTFLFWKKKKITKSCTKSPGSLHRLSTQFPWVHLLSVLRWIRTRKQTLVQPTDWTQSSLEFSQHLQHICPAAGRPIRSHRTSDFSVKLL